MHDHQAAFIDKIIYGVIATIGILLVNFLIELNQKVEALNIQLARTASSLEFHEGQLQTLAKYNETIFRVETELGMHEKRISILER